MESTFLLQIILVTVPSVLADIQMKFTKNPESIIAPIGHNVTFECQVSVPGERLTWRWRLDTDSEDSWIEVNGVTKNNIYTKLNVEVKPNNTLYQCVGWYGGISLVSVPAKLTVAKFISKIKTTPKKRVVTAPPYNTVILHCKEPISVPPAFIEWWRDTKGNILQIESNHEVLVIHNATAKDSGTYICSATNQATKEKTALESIVLKIENDDGRTRFLQKSDEFGPVDDNGVIIVSAKINETVRLWCDVVGSPPPLITWSHEKKDLSYTHRHTLTIFPLTEADQGIYNCTTNTLRRSWKVIALQAPSWEGIVGNVSGCEGNSADIVCGTPHGQPPPKVHWLLNAEKIAFEKGIQANDSMLHIERVEKRHAGIVQCFACNSLGCAYDGTLLTVVPMQISDKEYMAEAPKTLHSSQHTKKHKKRRPILTAPSRPNVTRFSDDSVMLSWSQQNTGLPVEFYKIQYREVTNSSNGNDWQTDNTRISYLTHSYQMDGLTTNTYYKFRVAAVYSNKDNKQGKSSNKFFLQKGGFEAPAPPVLTAVEAVSSTSVKLFWTWSLEGDIMPDGFYVYYRTVSTAGSYEKAMVAGGVAARSTVVSHLLPDTQYEFKMLSYSAQAPSNFSKILEAKTLRAIVVENATLPTPPSKESETSQASPALLTGSVLCAVTAVIILAVKFLLCRRARRNTAAQVKVPVPESGGANGYIPAKVPLTTNTMHAEGGDEGEEMSFMHNNNTGNDDTLPHSRKNGPAQQYV